MCFCFWAGFLPAFCRFVSRLKRPKTAEQWVENACWGAKHEKMKVEVHKMCDRGSGIVKFNTTLGEIFWAKKRFYEVDVKVWITSKTNHKVFTKWSGDDSAWWEMDIFRKPTINGTKRPWLHGIFGKSSVDIPFFWGVNWSLLCLHFAGIGSFVMLFDTCSSMRTLLIILT